jgi:GT2 family glycosyltransferase
LPSEGRNLGAYFAQGDLLVFLDDDAIAAPGYVESIMLAWQIFDFSALRGRILPKSSLANQAVSGHYDLGPYPVPAALMTEGNMAIKKEVFLSVGGFDPLVFGGEGTELSHRCIKVMPGKDIYYWPGMLIFHDFARGKNFAAKKQRHAIASEYFNYLAPEINRLQAQYGRWYQMHPNKSVKYDNRGFAKKARAWIIETWTLLLNKFK